MNLDFTKRQAKEIHKRLMAGRDKQFKGLQPDAIAALDNACHLHGLLVNLIRQIEKEKDNAQA